MTDSSQAVKLHHRWALGETLTAEEQKILDAWYAGQDIKEAATLKADSSSSEFTQSLREQVQKMLQQLSESVNHIRQLSAENEQLKKENEQLKKLLASRLKQLRA